MANVDEGLRRYATDAEWLAYVAYCETGSFLTAGRQLGKDRTTIRNQVRKVQERALRAGAAPVGFKVTRVSTQYDEVGEPKSSSVVVKAAAEPDDVVKLPDPKKIIKTSTLYAGDGSVTQQWVLEKPEDVQREVMWEAFAARVGEGIPEKPALPAPDIRYDDLLSVYPVGDHHTGMLAWAAETGGDNYDIKIAQSRLAHATRILIDQCPPSEQALIPFLGDFFHYDSYKPVTPTSGHIVDGDVRFPKMFDMGCDMVEYVIDAALEKHKNVHIIWETGNHDPTTAAAMRTFLRRLYRNNPRVTVDTSPQFFHYYRFGSILLGTNHGDKVKPAGLVALMAADQAKAWGETTYRMWMTGHVHHEARKEFPGCFWESFGVLAPADAYAATGGWRSICQMHAIVFNRNHGLAGRHVVYPSMFEAGAA